MGDRGADVPALGRRDAQLSERERRSSRVRVPAALRRGSKRRQRSMRVADVECGVRLDEPDGGAQRGADGPSLGDDVVFESARKPESRRILDDDDR